MGDIIFSVGILPYAVSIAELLCARDGTI
jgi:hypothetical protein